MEMTKCADCGEPLAGCHHHGEYYEVDGAGREIAVCPDCGEWRYPK